MANDDIPMKTFLPGYRKILFGLFLIVATLAVYWQVGDYDFINFDDDVYVYDNPYVKAGLKEKSITWAFGLANRSDGTYWHPLTWLSHMLDCELYGMNPGMHHLSNLIIHITNSLLLFLVLNRMSGAFWRSACVATLFALHPINVETVAWVTERKNVLSTLFWMLTILTYSLYAKRPSLPAYLLTLVIFILGLLAKPMLVTLPFVLLLLDYWPLGRLQLGQWCGNDDSKMERPNTPPQYEGLPISRLILEKTPFFIFSGISIYVSFVSMQHSGSVSSSEVVPMVLRIENALVSYVKYFSVMIWPQHLAVYYPYPVKVGVWQSSGALLLIGGISASVVWLSRQRPYLLVGWLWYLGTLFPVIGLTQAGLWPAMANRWAYVPLIGLFIMITWGVAALVREWRYRRIILALSAGIVFSGLMLLTWRQVGYWKNSASLFEHAVRVTSNNSIAHNNLGNALAAQGNLKDAIRHYGEALRIRPDFVKAHNNLGLAREREGNVKEATHHYLKALHFDPHYAEAHYNLGNTLAHQGAFEEALNHYAKTLSINPHFAEAHNNAGNVLFGQRKLKEAINHYAKALHLEPEHVQARHNLQKASAALRSIEKDIADTRKALKRNSENAALYCKLGDLLYGMGTSDEAIFEYQKALAIDPESIRALYSLAMVYTVTSKDYEKARALFDKIIALRPDAMQAYYGIASLYARQHKREEAVSWLKKAVERGFNNWDLLKTDNGWESIRDSSYYQELVRAH